jgi:hypothetical protein
VADDKQLAYANSILSSHSAYFGRGSRVRAVTRMQDSAGVKVDINGKTETFPPNGRALSLVMQFRSFAERQPKVVVTPKSNQDREERKAQDIERFLYGVPRAVSKVRKSPYADAVFNYAEVGRGILYTRFDETLAVQGKFPFKVKAVDPLSCALHVGDEGLIAGVIKETYAAEALMRSLVTYYEDAETYGKEKPKWSVPASLRKKAEEDPLSTVDTLELLTDEYCCFYVGDEKVYEYELHPGGVPLDVGFGIDLPSSKPEEWGMGLVYPISGMLDNEWKLLNKETLANLYYSFPFLVYKDGEGNLFARHLKPSLDPYAQVAEYEITTPVPNYQGSELLLNKIEQGIGRLTLNEVSFGENDDTQSGYQVNLLSQPTQLRMKDQMAEAKAMWERHYGRLLRSIEYYATEAMAKEMGAKDVARYLSSFSTIAGGQFDPQQKQSNRVALTSEMVKGYDEQDIEVKLQPEPAADENAKAQRIGLYKEAGYPQQFIDKYVEKVENQAELNEFRQQELLRANNPLWAQFELEETRIAVLEKDKEKAKRWTVFLEAQGLDEHGNPIEEEAVSEPAPQAPVDPLAGQMPLDPAMMGALLGGGMPADPMGAQLNPMGVGADMVSPAQMGMQPMSPEEMALQQTFRGGG